MLKVSTITKTLIVSLLAALCPALPAHAGSSQMDGGSCTDNGIGTVSCQGNYFDIKLQRTEPGRWVSFRKWATSGNPPSL
jgi:hypothetical protein